jgi:SAM-dependent methyltransferase
MVQDSSRPEFWDTRYRGGVTPWDAGGVPRFLDSWLSSAKPGRVLLPGCGSGYEVRAFAEHGHDVTAIEFSDAAIDAAKRELGPLAGLVKKADFFSFEAAVFDRVYERAFLCALPRKLWTRWALRMAELVRPGGELVGFFFLDDNERGPPFGISQQRLDELLKPAFGLQACVPIDATESLPVFNGKEVWQVWRRQL